MAVHQFFQKIWIRLVGGGFTKRLLNPNFFYSHQNNQKSKLEPKQNRSGFEAIFEADSKIFEAESKQNRSRIEAEFEAGFESCVRTAYRV